MFIASKAEDEDPLGMDTLHEKIAHRKFEISVICKIEIDILKTLSYEVKAPTVLDFLKIYLFDVLNIRIMSEAESDEKLDYVLRCKQFFEELQKST